MDILQGLQSAEEKVEGRRGGGEEKEVVGQEVRGEVEVVEGK